MLPEVEVPEITDDDLIAYLGGRSKCRSPKVASYIGQQRKVAGSPITQWYDEIARRAAATPEDIDWALLFAEEPLGIAELYDQDPQAATTGRTMLAYAAQLAAFWAFWGVVVWYLLSNLWPFIATVGLLLFSLVRCWKRCRCPEGTLLESVTGGYSVGFACWCVAWLLKDFGLAPRDWFLFGGIGAFVGSLLGITQGFGLRNTLQLRQQTFRDAIVDMTLRSVVTFLHSGPVFLFLDWVWSMFPCAIILWFLMSLAGSFAACMKKKFIEARAVEVTLCLACESAFVLALVAVSLVMQTTEYWPIGLPLLGYNWACGVWAASTGGVARWWSSQQIVYRSNEVLLAMMLVAAPSRWLVDALIGALQLTGPTASVLLNFVVFGSIGVGIYLGVSRKWLLLIPKHWRSSFTKFASGLTQTPSAVRTGRVDVLHTTGSTVVAVGDLYRSIWSTTLKAIEHSLGV